MKTKKIALITITLLIASAVLLTGSLALLVGASENEVSLPEDSVVPDVSEMIGELQPPAINDVSHVEIKDENGKQVVSILTEQEMNLLAERRANGEWLTLSMEEMTAIVKETVNLFYDCYRIDLGELTDGVYSVKSYYGYQYYTSEEYTKQDWQDAPKVEKDVLTVILARVRAYNDSVEEREDYGYYYAYADMSAADMARGAYFGHVVQYDEENGWSRRSFDYLMFDSLYNISITSYTHNREQCITSYDQDCCEAVLLFCTDQFKKDFVNPEFVEGSRRVRVEIFEEATKTLVDTFTVTDQDTVNAIFENFYISFQNACHQFEAHVASDEDRAYRSDYRIVVHMESTLENVVITYVSDMDICYPYGYSNDIYGYLHNDIWVDYLIQGGSDFINLIDAYVGSHIPA